MYREERDYELSTRATTAMATTTATTCLHRQPGVSKCLWRILLSQTAAIEFSYSLSIFLLHRLVAWPPLDRRCVVLVHVYHRHPDRRHHAELRATGTYLATEV